MVWQSRLYAVKQNSPMLLSDIMFFEDVRMRPLTQCSSVILCSLGTLSTGQPGDFKYLGYILINSSTQAPPPTFGFYIQKQKHWLKFYDKVECIQPKIYTPKYFSIIVPLCIIKLHIATKTLFLFLGWNYEIPRSKFCEDWMFI